MKRQLVNGAAKRLETGMEVTIVIPEQKIKEGNNIKFINLYGKRGIVARYPGNQIFVHTFDGRSIKINRRCDVLIN